MSNHKHKVEDARKRSILKALTGNGFEIIIDTLLIGSVLHLLEMPYAFGFAGIFSVVTEFLCFVTNYFNDRAWNKIQWGRVVEDIDEFDTNKVEHL